jgi:hypothetical protein
MLSKGVQERLARDAKGRGIGRGACAVMGVGVIGGRGVSDQRTVYGRGFGEAQLFIVIVLARKSESWKRR